MQSEQNKVDMTEKNDVTGGKWQGGLEREKLWQTAMESYARNGGVIIEGVQGCAWQ